MKAVLLTPCVLAALLLTGCGGASEEAPGADQSGAVTSSPPSESVGLSADRLDSAASPTATAEITSKDELEARLSGLTDVRGGQLQLVSMKDMEEGLKTSEDFVDSALIDPTHCRNMVADGMALSQTKATEGVLGMGEADTDGGVFLLAILDGSTPQSVDQRFNFDRERLRQCSPLTLTVGETTTTLVSDELPQDLIGEESYALLASETSGTGDTIYTLIVTARDNGLIASAQSMSTAEPDGILQDDLADLAAQALEPANP